jgi:hypothetical protein
MDGATFTLWAFAILGALGTAKYLIVVGLPDVEQVIDRVLTFCERVRARWRRFRQG